MYIDTIIAHNDRVKISICRNRTIQFMVKTAETLLNPSLTASDIIYVLVC